MSQQNVARADLRPVTASQLKGRPSQRGKLLTVTDPNGDVVVQAALGKTAKSAYAVFEASVLTIPCLSGARNSACRQES